MADFEAQLVEKYQERPVYRGVTRGGALLQVFVSKSGETWTIAVQLPNGLACLLSAGEAWRALDDAGAET